MSTTEAKQIDKSKWADGPWMREPDRVEFKTAAGLPALIVRNDLGNLCGYVAVSNGHPCFGRSECSGYERGEDGEEDYDRRIANPYDEIGVHGGITYTGKCQGQICHVPEPGEPDDVWWSGFDCAHSGDHSPGMDAMSPPHMRSRGWEVYRTVDYVRAECESLAEQLARMVRP